MSLRPHRQVTDLLQEEHESHLFRLVLPEIEGSFFQADTVVDSWVVMTWTLHNQR